MTRHLACIAAAFLIASQAQAADVTSVAIPHALADKTVAIGGRSVTLPEGNWNVVARSEGSIKSGVMHTRPHWTVYAADVDNARLRAGIVLRMPASSVRVSGWNEDPCKVSGEIHKEQNSPEPKLDDCLVVWKRASHLRGANPDAFYAQAKQWFADSGVAHTGAYYEIFYSRFAANDFGWVRVHAPSARFANDEAAIAWARQLPAALQRVFEGRESAAQLPALPAQR